MPNTCLKRIHSDIIDLSSGIIDLSSDTENENDENTKHFLNSSQPQGLDDEYDIQEINCMKGILTSGDWVGGRGEARGLVGGNQVGSSGRRLAQLADILLVPPRAAEKWGCYADEQVEDIRRAWDGGFHL